MPRFHRFDPEGLNIEIQELTGYEVQRIAEQAAKKGGFDIIVGTMVEADLKRRQCLRGFRTMHVDKGDSVADMLHEMRAQHIAYLDAAIGSVHDVPGEEIEGFLSTATMKEV
jgi:hypothetical protein